MGPRNSAGLIASKDRENSATPRFSVVIPLYNKANHISRAIDSVLGQYQPDFELVVVNDGSTDGSGAIVERYSDDRLRLVNQSNAGESAARNTGIKGATAPFVAFLDADDAWDPDFLSVIDDLIKTYPDAAVYATHIRNNAAKESNSTVHDPGRTQGSWMIENYFEDLRSGHYSICSSSACARRDALIAINGFDETLTIGPDQDTWIRLFLHSGIAMSNRVAATYYPDADNRSIQRPDYTVLEYQFLAHLRDRYLTGALDQRSHHALDEMTARRIYEAITKLTWRGQKQLAFDIMHKHWPILSLRRKMIARSGLLMPKPVIRAVRRALRLELR